MSSINDIQNEIIDEFSLFDDLPDRQAGWMDKYEHIIGIGKDVAPLADEHKTADNLVKGCQSRVWLHAEMRGDNLHFEADSDAIITKGLVGLMMRVLSDHAPAEIMNADLFFVEKIGLQEHLSPTRSNGLVSMIKKMKMYAMAFHARAQMDQK